MDNSRMLQRNGRVSNLSAYSTIPHYSRTPLRQGEACGECASRAYSQSSGCGCSSGKACGCGEKCGALAIPSIEMQKWRNIYELENGLSCGTIFGDLDLPFCGMRGVRQ